LASSLFGEIDRFESLKKMTRPQENYEKEHSAQAEYIRAKDLYILPQEEGKFKSTPPRIPITRSFPMIGSVV
jgi:hypothetical protein